MQKSTLILALVLLCAPMTLMAQQATLRQGFAQPGVSGTAEARNSRATFSRVTWYFLIDPPTECSFKIEQSSYGITWTDLTPPQDCTSEGKFEFITSVIDKVIRFNVTAFAAPPSAIVTIFWEGYTGQKCGKDYNGIFSTIVSPDPTAGEELSIDIPSNERWRVYSASAELQANSVVADREVFLTASENGNEYFRTFADGVVAANQKGIFTAAALGFVGTVGLGPSAINQSNDVRTLQIPIYSEVFIPGGHTLATDTGGIQAGDDYSPAVVLVERCPN